VCVSVLVFCCSVSSLFLSCVLCACDLLIVIKKEKKPRNEGDANNSSPALGLPAAPRLLARNERRSSS